MTTIIEIENSNLKSTITEKILLELPEWFGDKNGIDLYSEKVKNNLFIESNNGMETTGFISIKIHNKYTAEILVMAVLKPYHHQGIGKLLITEAISQLKDKNIHFLTVKTLAESAKCKYYEKTRGFYNRLSFYPLEESTEIWGIENPCLIMMKII